MSVLLQTTLGPLVIDLNLSSCPVFCHSFLSLCSINYYSKHLIFNVIQNRFLQTGDPTGTGTGGSSIHGLTNGKESRFLKDELTPLTPDQRTIKGLCLTTRIGNKASTQGSQFTITTASGPGMSVHEYSAFDEAQVFGQVVEDTSDVLRKINEIYTDKDGRPYTDVRVEWCEVIDWGGMEVIEDTIKGQLRVDRKFMDRPEEENIEIRIKAGDEIEDDVEGKGVEEVEEELRKKEAKSRAVVLEMIGDIKSADDKPPENVLFICKLNPVTEEDDLELIFSR